MADGSLFPTSVDKLDTPSFGPVIACVTIADSRRPQYYPALCRNLHSLQCGEARYGPQEQIDFSTGPEPENFDWLLTTLDTYPGRFQAARQLPPLEERVTKKP